VSLLHVVCCTTIKHHDRSMLNKKPTSEYGGTVTKNTLCVTINRCTIKDTRVLKVGQMLVIKNTSEIKVFCYKLSDRFSDVIHNFPNTYIPLP